MRIVKKILNIVLHRAFSALVLSFAQIFLALASTKSATVFKQVLSVLESFLAVSFFLQIIYLLNLHRSFFAVKSLEENLVINSAKVVLS